MCGVQRMALAVVYSFSLALHGLVAWRLTPGLESLDTDGWQVRKSPPLFPRRELDEEPRIVTILDTHNDQS